MSVLASTAGEVMRYAAAFLFVALGALTAYMLFWIGRAFQQLTSFIRGSERDVLPVVVKAGGTVDRVNDQLDKLDVVTDTAVRAVSTAITTPVKKVTGVAAGVSHGFSAFRARRDFGEAVNVGKQASTRRQSELDEELRAAGRSSTEDAPPAA